MFKNTDKRNMRRLNSYIRSLSDKNWMCYMHNKQWRNPPVVGHGPPVVGLTAWTPRRTGCLFI